MASTGPGVMVLVAVGKGDDEKEADGLIGRVLRSQLWPDDNGTEWKRNVRDIEGEILCGMRRFWLDWSARLFLL